MPERREYAAGCLLIACDGFEEDDCSGLSAFLNGRGMLAEAFEGWQSENPHLALQCAYQSVRRRCARSAILGIGAGCHAALALAGQLPVDRLVLLTGAGIVAERLAGTLRRLRAYARRNAALCVAEVLILQAGEAERGLSMPALQRALANCRVSGAQFPAIWRSERKDQMNMAVYRFLSEGVLPKNLAEKSEMCIIYG